MFLALAFGLRAVISSRVSGRSGFVAPVSPLDTTVNLVWVLGAACTLAAPFLDLLGVSTSPAPLDEPIVRAIGVVVALAGAALALRAQAQMATSWRAGIDVRSRTALVTSGVFARVRNPFYAGCVLVAVGVLLLVPNVASAAGVGLTALGSYALARFLEEPYLLEQHGDRYRAYQRGTGRFVPRLRPRPSRPTEE